MVLLFCKTALATCTWCAYGYENNFAGCKNSLRSCGKYMKSPVSIWIKLGNIHRNSEISNSRNGEMTRVGALRVRETNLVMTLTTDIWGDVGHISEVFSLERVCASLSKGCVRVDNRKIGRIYCLCEQPTQMDFDWQVTFLRLLLPKSLSLRSNLWSKTGRSDPEEQKIEGYYC